ncbi:hypothetical protein [Streptomyces goshikiensis]|uniref:hypothetical protein n=1 Tax=Streptomyces goshikiensis TaxID=1942 RepID=UPI003665C619
MAPHRTTGVKTARNGWFPQAGGGVITSGSGRLNTVDYQHKHQPEELLGHRGLPGVGDVVHRAASARAVRCCAASMVGAITARS